MHMMVTHRPKVSVIVVSRNRRAYLEELITSLTQQTFKDFEIILIENASLADTRDFVKELQLPIPLKKVFLEEEQTISACRNYPFEHNIVSDCAKYIYFIDDDDAIFSHSLKAMVSRIERTGAQVVHANSVRVYCKGEMLKNPYPYIRYREELFPAVIGLWRTFVSGLVCPNKSWLIMRHVYASMAIHSLLFDINLFKKHRFEREITYGEDSQLYYDMMPSVRKVSKAPFVFVLYRRHGNNTADPHNIAKKVRANPLSLEFCLNNYPLSDCYMLFFREYTDYEKGRHRKGSNSDGARSEIDEKMEKFSIGIPLSVKVKTALFYPFLSVRFAFFRARQQSRSLFISTN